MKQVIWKFGPVNPGEEWTKFDLDSNGEIVHYAIQGRNLFFWALVDPDAPFVEREFMSVPTGLPGSTNAQKKRLRP